MRLTELSHGAGCACKLDADRLEAIRASLPMSLDANLLVGLHPADDAAVYRVAPTLAVVQTIDFFTPIVDDPFDYGRIAAANALSDIYAMGATPLFALNVLAFSLDELPVSVLTSILRGAADIAGEAGIAIAGGHSIDDPEPKFGLTVTGTVHPDRILRKSGARAGDILYLTKPVGGGLVTTAAKHDAAPVETVAAAVEVMTTLNHNSAREARTSGASAMTDVTGFGLLGHLHEICVASELEAEVDSAAVPSIPGALELASDPRARAGGSRRNANRADRFTNWAPDVDPGRRILLTDAMTSGGLLVCIPDASSGNQPPGVPIGRLVNGRSAKINVR